MAGSSAARFFPRIEGGEMWSRWDMQDHPPDILITNYSMMNIMLMRSMEMPIFDLTRRGLQADTSRLFHLVVDELHTYRGTPGDRSRLHYSCSARPSGAGARSQWQLRIIASSASLTDIDASGLDYLEAFFGRDRSHFQIIGGNTVNPNPASVPALQSQAAALRNLGESLRAAAAPPLQAAAQSLHSAVGAPTVPAGALRAEQIDVDRALNIFSDSGCVADCLYGGGARDCASAPFSIRD